EILVVTFTRAATKELHDRVRRRLRQAAAALAFDDGKYDEILIEWRDNLKNIEKSRAAIGKALSNIDRAEISSIHSFCQRALQEHALSSGEPPDNELADEKDCQREAAEDFWRRAVYPLPPWLAALVCRHYPNPEELAKSVAEATGGDADIRPGNLSPEEARASLAAAHHNLASWWRQNANAFRARLKQAMGQGYFKKELTDHWLQGWQRLDEFAAAAALSGQTSGWPEEFFPWLTTDGLRALVNGQKIRDEAKKEALLAGLAPLADREVSALTEAASRFLLALRLQIATFLRREVPIRLRRAGQVSYNELTRRLAQAVTMDKPVTPEASPAANSTANLTVELQNRYRMALIDEFQDTDIWQWRIFEKLFAAGKHYLYLIGDPKQAIYRFRGADIFSYFQAGKEASQRLTLTKNFRSHPLLVAEINRLFAGRPKPFLFPEEQISFEPAQAGRGAEDGWLWQNGVILPACRYRLVTVNEKNQEGIERAIRDDCLRQILKLLNPDNPAHYIRMENSEEINRCLTAEDIAILTRSNNEAEELTRSLASHGIMTALDSRVSVFKSKECEDLLTALAAVAAPGRMTPLARALACDWFGLDGDGLAALLGNEEQLGTLQERWHGYQRRWLADGVAAAIQALLAGEAVYEHLRLQPRFERRIANIFHLSELLSAAEISEDFGPSECLDWLRRQAKDGGGDNSELRIESDRPSVRVVTMHSAKGLEFPVVFCPSLWRGLAGKKRSTQAACHDGDQAVVDLGSPEFAEACERATNEERAEELRLLYVALTRAKLQCVVFWPLFQGDPSEVVANSPLFYLLAGGGAVVGEEMRQLFLGRAQAGGVATEETGNEAANGAPIERQSTNSIVTARQFHGQFDLSWQMASFSSLARSGNNETFAAEITPSRTGDARTEADGEKIALPLLPKGARFGNLIHTCLDKIDFTTPEDQLMATTTRQAERQAPLFGFAGSHENIARLIMTTITAALPAIGENAPGGWRLTDLQQDKIVKEMPWSFALKRTWPQAIGALLSDDLAVAPLSGPPVAGYLTGFIDLFCQWQGKYYLLDYKTNFLGDRQTDYTTEALTQVMAEHNYGLQYWLYTLAVDRWLAWQHPDYDYDQHFGGVYYFFVRGMRRELPGAGVFATRPDRAMLNRLAALLGEKR
ncbi:MAG: exodeoxyribonuclease V subunit beta, partial [Desulfobulbaceae bacterium]|nr:exodeoxyribonuclease V subunit beta [Desulfobulbaceae bacterium]